jgi:hypothetical protein
MDYDDIMFKMRGYLEDRNYVAACLFLKNEELDEQVRYEITGEVAKQVVNKLAVEKNKEKVLYLRSMLVWLFKDVPGLATVYREQLRLASDSPNIMRDFMRGMRTFADVATGGESEAFGDKVEEAADNLRPEAIQEKVKDFFSDAGIDVDEGIKKAKDFFDGLAGNRAPGDEPESDSEPRDVGGDSEE